MNPHEFSDYFLLYLPRLLGSVLLVQTLRWMRSAYYRLTSYVRRKEIIREAIGSSLDIKDRLYGWSSAGSRPISMRFHDVWQHNDCEVMKWYHSLPSGSTTFRSIQHCRNIKGPFYHEFLLIKLDNGDICRLERMGEGVDTDAIRWTGCISHDIIQHFTQSQYSSWPQGPKHVPSEVITEVTFPRTFDLMDVLAICYAIKQHVRARNYTLQRFNCYFLCCTILSILARRIVSWENQITVEAWTAIRKEIRNDLEHYDPSNFLDKKRPDSGNSSKPTLHLPPNMQSHRSWNEWLLHFWRNSEEDAIPLEVTPTRAPDLEAKAYAHDVQKYVSVGICSLLDPQSVHPEEFLLASLMSRLNEDARLNLREELSLCLWQERLEATVMKAIKHYVRNSARSIITGTARGSKKMSDLLGNVNEEVFPRDNHAFSSIREDVQKGFLRAFLRICHHHINISRARYNIEAFEGQYPWWKKLGAVALGLVITTLAYPAVALLPYLTLGTERFGMLRDDLVILDMCKTFQVNPRAMVWAFTPAILARQVKYEVLGVFREVHDSYREQDAFEWNMHLVYGWTEELALILERFLRPGQVNIEGALAFLNTALPGFIWKNCLLGCVAEKMGECVRRDIECMNERVQVHGGSTLVLEEDAEMGTSQCTVQEFQGRLLERIKLHAKRVDSFQFAEKLVVESGMANAMCEIWVSLPTGSEGT